MHHWKDQSLFGPPRATNLFAGFSPPKKELWILFQTHRTCVISCHFPGLVIFDIRKPVPKYHPETRWLQVPGVKSHRVPHPFSSFYQLHPRIWWIFDTWVRRDVLDFFHFQGGAVELLESEWSQSVWWNVQDRNFQMLLGWTTLWENCQQNESETPFVHTTDVVNINTTDL